MPTIDRITLKEAVLVGGAPGHQADIREGGARYAKVLYGVREPLFDERWGTTALMAYHVTGFIFQYRFFRVPTCVVKIADTNVLGIDQRYTEAELRERLGVGQGEGLNPFQMAALARLRAKTVDFGRAYGATEEIIEKLPCGCPTDHAHGRPRPRQYCLERGCHQCHLAVPEHWHASNDGTVRQ